MIERETDSAVSTAVRLLGDGIEDVVSTTQPMSETISERGGADGKRD